MHANKTTYKSNTIGNSDKLYLGSSSRAVLERNRDFLTKGAAKASLMNVMMQQRKVCNHPYLLEGAEDHITAGIEKTTEAELSCLINSSSKLVFLDKLLTRLRENKKRVLIFSQMVG